MNRSSNLVHHKKIRTFNVLVWHLIPSWYAIITSCMSLCQLQPTVAAAGIRTTFLASVSHDCLHSKFDIGFAISYVNSDTNEEVHQWKHIRKGVSTALTFWRSNFLLKRGCVYRNINHQYISWRPQNSYCLFRLTRSCKHVTMYL